MNSYDRYHCPAPTAMHSIIGDADHVLEYNKFAVFALVSSLLVPRAAVLFQAVLRREKQRKKRHERFVKSYFKKRRREFKNQGERHLERLLELVDDHLFFRHQPRTVNSISKKRPPFNPPHWTGDSAEGLTPVPLPARFPDASYLIDLVKDLGYPIEAALAAMAHPQMWQKPDRRRNGVWEDEELGRMYDRTLIAQPVPYVAAPSRRTTQGFFSRDSVLKAVARMRGPYKMRMATFQVVFSRQNLSRVAKEFGVGASALKQAAIRVRRRIHDAQKPNVYAGSERDVIPICP